MSRSLLFAFVLAGCSSSSSGATGDAGPSAPPADAGPAPTLAAAVLGVGTLASSDVATAQATHDKAASQIEGQAESLGDVGHTVMLGTSLLGTHANKFLSLDRWRDAEHVNAFYANPDFKGALASLLSTSTLDFYVPATGWKAWGSPDAANDAEPHYWIVVRGRLKSDDPATNRSAHDAVAGNFEGPAKSAGDVGHVVFVGRDDPRLFFAIDVWKDATNIASFYGSPDLASALATVLEPTPTLGVYASTKWHQW